MKRRHFLGSIPGSLVLSSCRKSEEISTWKGIQMGIAVTVNYRGLADFKPALAEVAEAEAALTLWDQDSPISRLNREGSLQNPPRHLLACLKKARELFEASEGRFDPTIHSYLEWAKGEYEAGRTPPEDAAHEKLKLVDFSRVQISTSEITLPEGAALSLNGLAQGYLTDVFAEAFNTPSALVNFGEFRVIGSEAWPVEVAGKNHSLTRALAVSSGGGQRLSATSSANHLIDPKSGLSPDPKKIFAVEADHAWLADGLATLIAIGAKIPVAYRSQARIIVGSSSHEKTPETS